MAAYIDKGGSSEAYPMPLKAPQVTRNTENLAEKLYDSSKGTEKESSPDHVCLYGYNVSDKQNCHSECQSNQSELSKDLLLTRKSAAVKNDNQKSHNCNEMEAVRSNQKQSGWKFTRVGKVYSENVHCEKSVDSKLKSNISTKSVKDHRTLKEKLKDKVNKSHNDQLLYKKNEVLINENKTGQEDICMPSKFTKYNKKHNVFKVKTVQSFGVDVIKDTQQERQGQLVPERQVELDHKKVLVLFSLDKNEDWAGKHDVSDYSELYVKFNGHDAKEKVKATPVYLVPNKHHMKSQSSEIPFKKKTENEKIFQNDKRDQLECFQPEISSELSLRSVYFDKEIEITSQSTNTHNTCEEEFMNLEQNDKCLISKRPESNVDNGKNKGRNPPALSADLKHEVTKMGNLDKLTGKRHIPVSLVSNLQDAQNKRVRKDFSLIKPTYDIKLVLNKRMIEDMQAFEYEGNNILKTQPETSVQKTECSSNSSSSQDVQNKGSEQVKTEVSTTNCNAEIILSEQNTQNGQTFEIERNEILMRQHMTCAAKSILNSAKRLKIETPTDIKLNNKINEKNIHANVVNSPAVETSDDDDKILSNNVHKIFVTKHTSSGIIISETDDDQGSTKSTREFLNTVNSDMHNYCTRLPLVVKGYKEACRSAIEHNYCTKAESYFFKKKNNRLCFFR